MPSRRDHRPRIATVLSADPWEQAFVDHARTTGGVRIVARAYEPTDIPKEVDLIIASVDTAWLTPACLRAWRADGRHVVGIHDRNDEPGRRLLTAGRVTAALSSDEAPDVLLNTVRAVTAIRSVPEPHATTTLVTGAAGAPGRSEIALGLACLLARSHRTLLIDLDRDNPALALRMGLPPTPCFDDALGPIRRTGTIPPDALHRFGNLRVLAGSYQHRPTPQQSRDTVWASQSYDHVVVDGGQADLDDVVFDMAGTIVLVCDASPVGIVRAAALTHRWRSRPPLIVLNNTGSDRHDVQAAARHAFGMEPTVTLGHEPTVRSSAVSAVAPPSGFLAQLSPLMDPGPAAEVAG